MFKTTIKRTVGFFDASEGVRSSMRLVFVFGSFWNMALCTYLAISGSEAGAIIATFTSIQASLGFAKVAQKNQENKK